MMEFLKIFLLLMLCFHSLQADRTVGAFIREHFSAENIHHINIFACYDDTNAVKFIRDIMRFDNAVSYNPISSDINLYDILRVNYYQVGIAADFDCPMSDIILDKFSEDLVFNESYFWLLMTNSSTLPVDILQNLPLTVQSEFTLAIRSDDKFKLYDVYNPSYAHGGLLNITYKGYWSHEDGLRNEFNQYKYIRRYNFHLLPLNLSTVLRHPPLPDLNTYLMKPVNRHLDTMQRFHWLLGMHLRDLFNFSINLKVFDSWGYFINGAYDGLLANVIDGGTDLGVAQYRFTPARFNVIKYTVSTLEVKLRFFFRHPQSNDLQNNFLKPFAMDLWWMIVAVGLLYWITMIIISRFEIIYNRRVSQENSIVETALVTLAALSQQGIDIGSTVISIRIAILSLFVWALFIFQFYSASIVGSLLTPTQRWITSIPKLLDSHLECAIENTPYMVDHFKVMHDPESKQMYEQQIKPTAKKPNGSWMTVADGLHRVREGGFAFQTSTASAYKIIQETFKEDEICELQELDMVGRCDTTMITPKNSPFHKMFVWGLRKTVETGLTQRHFNVWHYRCPQCPESYSSRPAPVSIDRFSPALFLLLIGNGVSFVIMIIEYLYFWHFGNNDLNNEETRESIATPAVPDDIEDQLTVISEYEVSKSEENENLKYFEG